MDAVGMELQQLPIIIIIIILKGNELRIMWKEFKKNIDKQAYKTIRNLLIFAIFRH